jgi:hypothetical protein
MTAPAPTLFVTLFAYAAQKYAETTGAPWKDVETRYRMNPDMSPWVGFRTLDRAARLDGERVLGLVDGSTLVTKARSRAAGLFLTSHADVWLTIDDDVYADKDVLARLVAAARETRGVVSAPCALRSGAHMNFGLISTKPPAGDLALASRTGLGLVAMHREAIDKVSEASASVTENGRRYPALFLERVVNHEWVGEDYAFSDRCREAGIDLWLLTEAVTIHAGRRAKLGSDLCVYVGDTDTAERMTG